MAYNSSLTSYPDIRATLDRALASAKGVRVRFPDKNAATTFKGRVHTMRYLDRKENCKIYPSGNPMYGRSVYDPLLVKTEPAKELADGTPHLTVHHSGLSWSHS